MDQERLRWKVNVRTADVALAAVPVPLRVLDVSCGDGALVRELVARLPNVLEMTGLDPDERMVHEARRQTEGEPRFRQGFPEHLPFPNEHFDLVVTALSFSEWVDPYLGLREVSRVLRPRGALVLAEVSSRWRRRSDDPPRMLPPSVYAQLFTQTGLRPGPREVVYRRFGVVPLIRAFIAYR